MSIDEWWYSLRSFLTTRLRLGQAYSASLRLRHMLCHFRGLLDNVVLLTNILVFRVIIAYNVEGKRRNELFRTAVTAAVAIVLPISYYIVFIILINLYPELIYTISHIFVQYTSGSIRRCSRCPGTG